MTKRHLLRYTFFHAKEHKEHTWLNSFRKLFPSTTRGKSTKKDWRPAIFQAFGGASRLGDETGVADTVRLRIHVLVFKATGGWKRIAKSR